eukprot:2105687-Heterocapsa_arctica.AAC.1
MHLLPPAGRGWTLAGGSMHAAMLQIPQEAQWHLLPVRPARPATRLQSPAQRAPMLAPAVPVEAEHVALPRASCPAQSFKRLAAVAASPGASPGLAAGRTSRAAPPEPEGAEPSIHIINMFYTWPTH